MIDLREVFRANYYYWFRRLTKIVPIGFAYACLKVGLIAMIIAVCCMSILGPIGNITGKIFAEKSGIS